MKKIVYLPLDERPCNAKYPVQLAAMTDLTLFVPPFSLLGDKKAPADCAGLAGWLQASVGEADAYIVSLDMLVYGGIVPSRLHHLGKAECLSRLETLRRIKRLSPTASIYAFHLVMRAPAYDSSEEEPDYYQAHGRQLFRYGWLMDKREYEPLNKEEKEEWRDLERRIPGEVLSDFTQRRETNASVNLRAIELVKEGVIDFLVIPLDDNAAYGFAAMEQRKLLRRVEANRLLDRIHLYPGADEVGCTLFARMFCHAKRFAPRLFVRYSSTNGPSVIPKYEDRSLNESVKAHLSAAGAYLADSPQASEAVLLVNAPPVGPSGQAEAGLPFGKRHRSYFTETNLREFVLAMSRYVREGHPIALADVATCNGGDDALLPLVAKAGLLSATAMAAYAGWNTSGNSLGTAISQAVIAAYYIANPAPSCAGREWMRHGRRFTLCRLLEDWGYQARIRPKIERDVLPGMGGSPFHLEGIQDQVEQLIRKELNRFLRDVLREAAGESFAVSRVVLPWKRTFEVDFALEPASLS